MQSLRNSGLNIVPMPVREGKEARAMRHVSAFEAGRVYLPESAPWLAEFLSELLAFSHSRYDDQVDSLTQALTWAEHKMGYMGTSIEMKYTGISANPRTSLNALLNRRISL